MKIFRDNYMDADLADMTNLKATYTSLATIRLTGRRLKDTSRENQKLITAYNGQKYWRNSLIRNCPTETTFTLSRLR